MVLTGTKPLINFVSKNFKCKQDDKMTMPDTKHMKRIERIELQFPGKGDIEKFEVSVPAAAELVGVQHDATILVVLVRDWTADLNATVKYTVLRVKDGVKVEEAGTRYIGTNGEWHLFEVRPIRVS